MYFDTDILLKYSDPIPAGASHFLCIYHGLYQRKIKFLPNGIQERNTGSKLDQMVKTNRQEVWWRKEDICTWLVPKFRGRSVVCMSADTLYRLST